MSQSTLNAAPPECDPRGTNTRSLLHPRNPNTEGEETQVKPIAPLNPPYSRFSSRQKWFIVTIASMSATFSGFASNIYFPAIPTIARDVHTTTQNINLTVTSYMIFQGISPTFWSSLADVYGRRITLMSTFLLFISASIGLALSNHFYQILILRCLQSSGSASTIAIGSGIIGDVTPRDKRGGVMGLRRVSSSHWVSHQRKAYTHRQHAAIGPVLGGVFAETLGWRAIFWFLVIYGSIYLLVLSVFLPETLRYLVGDGSILPPPISRSPFDHFTAPTRAIALEKPVKPLKLDFMAPIRILVYPEVFVTVFFLALHYAVWQMTLTAQSSLFASTYGIGDLDIGLTFLANSFGCMLGSLTTGKLLDRDYKRVARSYQGDTVNFPIEQARLRTVWIWSPLQWAAVLIFGWTLDKGLHISAPIIASFALAWAAISSQNVISTYLIDIFPGRNASATAAVNLARCLLGAGTTASVNPTINKLGTGWTFTMWTLIMVLSLGLVGVQQRYGAAWRKKREARESIS